MAGGLWHVARPRDADSNRRHGLGPSREDCSRDPGGGSGASRYRALRFLSLRQPPSLLLGDIHDLLADTANWNAETWDLEAGELPRLVRTFEILFEQIPEQFGVEVMWAGDKTTEERMVSREQMLEIVRQGRFGTTVRYRIQAARP